MAIMVFNTLNGRKEEFVPREPNKVSIYVCGITPYSQSHIGHSRFVVFWDVVRRYFEYKGYTVTMVQNFTDVEDKLIEQSRKTGKDPLQIAQKHIREFLKDSKDLGVLPPQHQPRASQHISDIVQMVDTLVQKGHAYEVDGDVYFGVESFDDYGRLSGRDTEDSLAGARVDIDAKKRDQRDFALWKSAKPGEPSWPSPWGRGRPGWHIECSAMSLKYLGAGFDFHGGGSDLVFPHHENEVAQSEAYLGCRNFVRYWVHHGMINMRDEKMSKSLGNIVTMRDVLDRYPGRAIRYFLLSTHYRKILEFGFELLDEAAKGWMRLQKTVDDASAYLWAAGWRGTTAESAKSMALVQKADETRARFERAMDDDFNTALAVGALFDLAREMNTAVTELGPHGGASAPIDALGYSLSTLLELGSILGLVRKPRFSPTRMLEGARGLHLRWVGKPAPERKKVPDALRVTMASLMRARDKARAERSWAVADGIRDSLKQIGIRVEDSKNGSKWRPEI